MPTTPQASASRARSPAMSRPRRVRRASQRVVRRGPAADSPRRPISARWLQHVADATDGVDQRLPVGVDLLAQVADVQLDDIDRKSTRLNSSHLGISYAVFCLKK